ncbi:protein NDRG1-like isoform X2 [Rhopilema esculentum]|uniref:protein NDRG1-like isoform X2 n=1 Tax=Rhopilema esculentum TaxID=499914 RepID=UPI0031D42051
MDTDLSFENFRIDPSRNIVHEKVETVGDFTVTIQEKSPDRKKVASLITFHDIGLNHSSFKEFFHHEDNLQLWDKFKIYHIDAPGQQHGAEKFSPQYQFPSLPNIAKMLVTVLEHYNLRNDVIGFGVGAGANVLLYLAMEKPEWITGLILVDPAGKSAGFREWGEEKLASWHLETKGFTSASEKFLIWHHFGNKAKKVNMEKVDQYIKEVANSQNPHNMAQFVRAYMSRQEMYTDVSKKISCSVLILTSEHSPYKEEANRLFSVLPKQKANIMEALDSVNVFFEDPSKCGEGMLLLMQGCHLVPTLRTRTASKSGPVRAPSMSEDY